MFKTIIMGQVRHVVGVLGAYLVSTGWVNQADANTLTGALMVVVAMGWSAYEKMKAK